MKKLLSVLFCLGIISSLYSFPFKSKHGFNLIPYLRPYGYPSVLSPQKPVIARIFYTLNYQNSKPLKDSTSFTYDADSNILQLETLREYDTIKGPYVPTDKNINTYDSRNNLTASFHLQFQAGKWDTSTAYIERYSYDKNDNIVSWVNHEYNTREIPFDSSIYTYDKKNNVTRWDHYLYYPAGKTMYLADVYSYIYDAGSHLIKEIYSVGSQKDTSYVKIYDYDNKWNLVEKKQSNYYGGKWTNFIHQDTFFTNSKGLFSGEKLFNDSTNTGGNFHYYFYNKGGDIVWDSFFSNTGSSDNFVSAYKFIYGQMTISTGIENTESSQNNDFKIYPNPTQDKPLIIENKNIEDFILRLTDITGKNMIEKKYSNTNQISLDVNYPPGIYLLNLQTKDGMQTFKLIKQ